MEATAAAEVASAAAVVDVVRWMDPPGPNSRMAMVVSAENTPTADVDAAMAVMPRERMDLIVVVVGVLIWQ